MSFSKYLISFTILFLEGHFLFGATAKTTPPILYYFCSSTDGHFTNPSPYQYSLTQTLKTLTSPDTSLATTGFVIAGTVYLNVTSYGLTLCRGDVSSEDCLSCASNAGKRIRQLCPRSKGAIIWYDDCHLKYSSREFFGKIDEQYSFFLYNVNNVSKPEQFNRKTKELLVKLSEEAVKEDDLFTVGESKLDSLITIYGLVQCTRDLSSKSCKKCLRDAVSRLPDCCDGKRGGRVVTGSCNVRYEIYPIVKSQV